ncbi:MAG: plastocyanin/azurin family copper-binding protein, partial [Dehalococcoidia bacterium]
ARRTLARLGGAVVAAAALALSVLFVAGCGGPGLDEVEPVRGVTEVAVQDLRFDAPVIEVPAGTEVTWLWEGSLPHDVVGDGFRSEVITDGEFAHRFETPGIYNYRCTLHGAMTGRVIVTLE